MNAVQINGLSRQLPSSWDEVTREQLLQIAGMFRSPIAVSDFRVRILFLFLKIPFKLFARMHQEDIFCMTQTLDFLLKENGLTRNLLPRMGRYHGPEDSMMSCTFGEYVKAQTLMSQYLKTKDEQYLDEMVAILYRPKKIFWFIRKYFTDTTDRRIRFVDRSVRSRAKKISRIPFSMRYAVLMFFQGVEGTFPRLFPNIYRPKEDSSGTADISDLVLSLAEGKTDDESIDRIMYSNLYNVMVGLEHKSKQYFEQKEKLSKNGH